MLCVCASGSPELYLFCCDVILPADLLLCAQVFPDKRSLKLLKSQSINVNWYQYCPETAVILLSTTVQGNILQPFAFRVRPILTSL